MRKFLILIAVALVLGCAGLIMAASSTNQTVTIAVSAINEVSVSGAVTLTVSTATAGGDPDMVTDATTTYNITTNGASKKITGAIDTAMPTDVTLKVNLTATDVGTSAGDVTLSTAPADLVTAISKKKGSTLTVTYKLSALVGAGEVASTAKTVTFTITNSE